MNLYHLKYFVTLAHFEHYTKAAERLSIKQPSLSNAIASLEKEMGIKLFEKDGRNIVLTRAGRLFLSDIEDALRMIDSSIENIKMSEKGEGRISIGYSERIISGYMPRLARCFMNTESGKNVDFDFEYVKGGYKELIEGLQKRKYDFVITDEDEEFDEIKSIPIMKRKMVAMLSEKSKLYDRESISLYDIVEDTVIVCEKDREIVEMIYKAASEKYGSITGENSVEIKTVSDEETAAALVAGNFGIAVLMDTEAVSLPDVKKLNISDESANEKKYYLKYKEGRYSIKVLEDFRNFVAGFAGNQNI